MEIINKDNFEEKVSNGKVMVDFFANWCGPCKMLSPILEELSNEKSDYSFYKVDVDNDEDLARRFGIMSIPTLIIFENGELKQKLVGFVSKEELEKVLN